MVICPQQIYWNFQVLCSVPLIGCFPVWSGALYCVLTLRITLCFEQVRKIGKVARAIAIMSHPIPNTIESHSVQIILPQKQLGRKSDLWGSYIYFENFLWFECLISVCIAWLCHDACWHMFLWYVFCCSYTHNVAPKWKFTAFVSAEAETENPQAELKPGIDLLGQVDELFFICMTDMNLSMNHPLIIALSQQ
jgi:hypothetical protein